MSVWKTETLGPEFRKVHDRSARTGFLQKHCGTIKLSYPGYDGYKLSAESEKFMAKPKNQSK